MPPHHLFRSFKVDTFEHATNATMGVIDTINNYANNLTAVANILPGVGAAVSVIQLITTIYLKVRHLRNLLPTSITAQIESIFLLADMLEDQTDALILESAMSRQEQLLKYQIEILALKESVKMYAEELQLLLERYESQKWTFLQAAKKEKLEDQILEICQVITSFLTNIAMIYATHGVLRRELKQSAFKDVHSDPETKEEKPLYLTPKFVEYNPGNAEAGGGGRTKRRKPKAKSSMKTRLNRGPRCRRVRRLCAAAGSYQSTS